ncbi:hypothetical protein [Legionella longbeachae]|uniref:hypothetical protein n=1 Tax=Legionella longbeachae TaxID=450 RepID=UPI0001BEBC8D|nr:hypothetical protein [Legionella longbeachae]EEZ95943.1 hypothetical protein LLB_1126 [Legionella longbeachae D-4968]
MNFHSKKLQSLVDNSKHFLENLTSLKDYISEDINSLESYLKTLSLDKNVLYTIYSDDGFIPTTEITSQRPIEGYTRKELLLWCPKTKCLMYEKRRYAAVYDSSTQHPSRLKVQNDIFEKIVSIPLSEADFEIKKIVYLNNHLEGFIKSILECYTES